MLIVFNPPQRRRTSPVWIATRIEELLDIIPGSMILQRAMIDFRLRGDETPDQSFALEPIVGFRTSEAHFLGGLPNTFSLSRGS